MIALKPAGLGQRSHDEIVWQHEQGTPDSACPTVWGNLLFLLTDGGIAKCLDVRTGELRWKERLGGGPYRASPVAADGRVYFLNTKGMTTVVAASENFQRLAKNPLDDETLASPVVSDGKLYLRGRKWLHCVGK